MSKIKYYGQNDLSIGWYMKDIFEVLSKFEPQRADYNINDIIEFWNIVRFSEQGIIDQRWDEDFVDKYNSASALFEPKIGLFFNGINLDNIEVIAEEVERQYEDDFVHLFTKYNLFKRIPAMQFKVMLDNQVFFIGYVLKEKKLVIHYDSVLRDYFLENSSSAEIILNKYEIEDREDTNIPKSLTNDDISIILDKYIDSSYSNPNYTKQIATVKTITLSDEIKLKAKRYTDDYIEKLFAKGNGCEFEYEVVFSKTQADPVEGNFSGRKLKLSYGTKWFDENLDYPTLLNNFIHLFEYVDWNFRVSLVSLESKLSMMEKLMGVKSKSEYVTGTDYSLKECVSSMQMFGYYDYLSNSGLFLERVVEWFFSDYLKEEFHIENFIVELPREVLTYREKCVVILPEIEIILKQIKQLRDLGKIEHELLYFSSTHMFVKDIPSLIQNKYVYACKDVLKPIFLAFFSDQSSLSHIEGIDTNDKNFYSIIKKIDISYEKIDKFNKPVIDFYIEHDILVLDENGFIRFLNDTRMKIYMQLNNYQTINYHRIPEKYQTEILQMISEGQLYFEDTFFSKDEQNYVNFYLNKSEFCNGHDLRNKYSHAARIGHQDDEVTHKQNYMILLKLLVLIIIKLNDELCVLDELKDEKGREGILDSSII